MTQEDNGNYTCEVRAPEAITLGHVTHHLYVRGYAYGFLFGIVVPSRVTHFVFICVCYIIIITDNDIFIEPKQRTYPSDYANDARVIIVGPNPEST